MIHPRHQLNEAFFTPIRLSLMAALGRTNEVDFSTAKSLLEVGDSTLSKAIAYLAECGYVTVTKSYAASRPKTWVAATEEGYRAYQQHLLALRAITENPPAGT
jgi:DNA-binding MarR family transcriptional regulator